jgi:hypothetical protein
MHLNVFHASKPQLGLFDRFRSTHSDSSAFALLETVDVQRYRAHVWDISSGRA